ncbi:unnamed protein product [Linum tenue]|uniref:BHLH domain-containing protein n=1 Tax=Linum tenue TaxID=586396 RepID=A0AAV0L1R3_9ROSI|nr:unnamed protein product [Linum tenue]
MSSGILYSSNLKYPDGELRKNSFQDLAVDLSPYNLHHQHHHHQQQQQHQGSNHSGLARLRSAPSSFFEDLVNGGAGGGFDDFRYFRPSSPDMDAIFSRLLSPTSNGNQDPAQELRGFVKQEAMDSSFQQNLGNESSGEWKGHGGDSAATFMDSIDLGSSVVSAAAAAAAAANNNTSSSNGSNLARHNSSPAGFFSSLVVENGKQTIGFHGIREVGPSPNNSTSSRLSSSRTTSFSTSAPRLLPQISENGEETFKTPNSGKRLSSNNSWDFTSSNGIKRLKQDNDGDDLDFFSTLNAMDNIHQQNGSGGGNRLTHHLSLPKTAAEMASVEKFLQLQGSVPCKTRAKRGFATHPRSIAERVRRTKISERMRKLQELFPVTDKQTNTAEMLDLAVEYIKDLQKQVKSMKDTKANCTCLREQKA